MMTDRLFLDANVLFAAAYRAGAGLAQLWELPDVMLLTSRYARDEAETSLLNKGPPEAVPGRLGRLGVLVGGMSELADPPRLSAADVPEAAELADPKDAPILLAAVAVGATHLLTSDRAHFGHLYNRRVAGVLVLHPGDYLRDALQRNP